MPLHINWYLKNSVLYFDSLLNLHLYIFISTVNPLFQPLLLLPLMNSFFLIHGFAYCKVKNENEKYHENTCHFLVPLVSIVSM